jgi:hypothetical protein
MPLNKELLDILACPKCKSALTLTPAQDQLVCEACKVAYPIEDEIPSSWWTRPCPWLRPKRRRADPSLARRGALRAACPLALFSCRPQAPSCSRMGMTLCPGR